MKKLLLLCGLSFALDTLDAAAMNPVEYEQARAASDEVASIAARYQVCKVDSVDQLKAAYNGSRIQMRRVGIGHGKVGEGV